MSLGFICTITVFEFWPKTEITEKQVHITIQFSIDLILQKYKKAPTIFAGAFTKLFKDYFPEALSLASLALTFSR